MKNDELVEDVRKENFYLKFKSPRDEKVLSALRSVDRGNYVPNTSETYLDTPVSIGLNQTCSQPSMVAFIDDILNLEAGMNVLEVGSGCGYHAAVTSTLLGSSGFLTTIEFLPELAKMAEKNLHTQFEDFESRLKVICGDGSIGYAERAKYDRIYLTAGVILNRFNPNILLEQLKDNGILVFPERYGSLRRFEYAGGKLIDTKEFPGICFVPLKGENS